MKQIHDFYFKISHLRNGEHFQMHWSIHELLGALVRRVRGLAKTWEAYHRDFGRENVVFKRNLVLEETKGICRKNKMRGNDFRFLLKAVAYAADLPEADQRAAAERLHDLLQNYKGADKKAQAENTALFTHLLHDLEKPENAAAIDRLGLSALVERLGENNRAVEMLYDQRSETLNAMREEGNMVSERRRVDRSYAALVNAINALYAVNEYDEGDESLREVLEVFIDGINARIEQTRLVFSRRTGRYQTTEEEETPGTSGAPEADWG
jgi:hypothetical protein